MTYATIEASAQAGRPVELYDFSIGAAHYRYTSADGDVSYGGNIYTAAPISRNAVEATSETARLALEIACDRSLGVLALFSTMPPEEIVAVTVRRLHAGDGEAVTLWIGRVLNVTWNPSSAAIHCESVYTSLKRAGLRRAYQKSCPHVVYGVGCTLNCASFVANKTVTTVTGNLLVIADMGAFADGYFAGGYLEWERTTGVFDRRAIRSQVGGTVVISFQIPGLVATEGIQLYPGCDHTLTTCTTKFANQLNYGGMPYFPEKNPFSGTPIY